MRAAVRSHPRVVEFLIECGADFEYCDDESKMTAGSPTFRLSSRVFRCREMSCDQGM